MILYHNCCVQLKYKWKLEFDVYTCFSSIDIYTRKVGTSFDDKNKIVFNLIFFAFYLYKMISILKYLHLL